MGRPKKYKDISIGDIYNRWTVIGEKRDIPKKNSKGFMHQWYCECSCENHTRKWITDNQPYGENLDVYEIAEVANFEAAEGKTPFEVIDETLYGVEKFTTMQEKVEWVCNNFEITQKQLEE